MTGRLTRTNTQDAIDQHVQVLSVLLGDAPRRLTTVETIALQGLISHVEARTSSCPCGYEICRCDQDEKRVGEA